MVLKKIEYEHSSIKDKAYDNLKEAVILGVLRPGEKLSEEKLAEMLGISRTPLREAIQILINDGWFVRERNRIKVSTLNEKEIKNLFFIRERLEALSAYQATINITNDFINSLSEILLDMGEMEKKNDAEGVVKAGQKFHNLITKQSNNNALEEILSHVLDQIRRYRHLGVETIPGRSRSAVKEHEMILEAIKSKNQDKAEEIMRKHIALSRDSIILSDKYPREEK